MDFTSVPIIVVCCYIIGEIYKALFKNKQEAYKLIPIVMAIIGGVLGIIIYLTHPEIILNAENIWVALGIGIVSGDSSTGANQIIKQIFKKNIVSVLAESTNSAYKANTYIMKERIDSLQAEMIQLVMQGVSNGLDRSAIEAECESKTLELKKLKQKLKDKQQAKNMFNAAAGDELEHIFQIIDSYQDLDSYNDLLVRRIIEKIVILSKDKIAITFSNGYELTQELGESGYETNCG